MFRFNTISDCQDYLLSKSLKKGYFFYNVSGFENYFTLEYVPFTYVDGYSIKAEITLKSKEVGELSLVL